MSGHSHFKTVAATKNANDAKKGKIFSKLGRVITIAVKEKGLKIENTSLGWVAKEEIAVSEKEKERAQKLFEALDENDAIQDIYSNLKL